MRIATALSNEQQRERVIAARAYEAFCRRGCEHGCDLDDWLNAERELASEPDDVLIAQAERGFEISIRNRAAQGRISFGIAPSSLLIVWSAVETDWNEQEIGLDGSTLSLTLLPEPVDPAGAEVTDRDGRVLLRLPYRERVDGN